jgi:CRP-like cAMP-binding protein
LHWAVATMTAVGYGDVSAANNVERLYSIVTQLIGAVIFGYIIGSISSNLETVDMRAAVQKAKMTEVKDYMHNAHLPPALCQKIKKFYSYYHARKSVFDEARLLDDLSFPLRCQIVQDSNKEILRTLDIIVHAFEKDFVADLIVRLRPMFFNSGDFISKAGKYAREMFFIQRGKVEVSVPSDLFDVVVAGFGTGAHFGEASLMSNTNRSLQIKSLTSCDIHILRKFDLEDLLNLWDTQLTQPLVDNSEMRRDILAEVYDSAYAYVHSNEFMLEYKQKLRAKRTKDLEMGEITKEQKSKLRSSASAGASATGTPPQATRTTKRDSHQRCGSIQVVDNPPFLPSLPLLPSSTFTSFLPSFFPSPLHSFLPSFTSFLPAFLHFLHLHFRLPSFPPSFLPSFLTYFTLLHFTLLYFTLLYVTLLYFTLLPSFLPSLPSCTSFLPSLPSCLTCPHRSPRNGLLRFYWSTIR